MSDFETAAYRVPVENMPSFMAAVEVYAMENNVAVEYLPPAPGPEHVAQPGQLVRMETPVGSEDGIPVVDRYAAKAYKADQYTSALRTGSVHKVFRGGYCKVPARVTVHSPEPIVWPSPDYLDAKAFVRFVDDLTVGRIKPDGFGEKSIEFLQDLSTEVQSRLDQSA